MRRHLRHYSVDGNTISIAGGKDVAKAIVANNGDKSSGHHIPLACLTIFICHYHGSKNWPKLGINLLVRGFMVVKEAQ
jgi:hypothetical protein